MVKKKLVLRGNPDFFGLKERNQNRLRYDHGFRENTGNERGKKENVFVWAKISRAETDELMGQKEQDSDYL
ncbi:MAG: hypothetical protein J6O18_05755 [Bacilli bacterium]|nr:hypothetical protein [Bacilli bacterium]